MPDRSANYSIGGVQVTILEENNRLAFKVPPGQGLPNFQGITDSAYVKSLLLEQLREAGRDTQGSGEDEWIFSSRSVTWNDLGKACQELSSKLTDKKALADYINQNTSFAGAEEKRREGVDMRPFLKAVVDFLQKKNVLLSSDEQKLLLDKLVQVSKQQGRV